MVNKNPIFIKTPNPIDVHVGRRIKLRRNMLKVSQEKLGGALNVTFQQIQKYENGKNRVSASKLQMIADILQVKVDFFFKDAPKTSDKLSMENTAIREIEKDYLMFMASKQGVQLVQAFVKIDDPKIRDKTLQFVKVISESYKK
ncbi:MAG: helix-turn-helix transcriptional regulator [Lentilitoribacter sp.]